MNPHLKAELDSAAQSMQSYRPGQPFTDTEKALGLMAFCVWLNSAMTDRKSYLDSPNVSAREVAIDLIEQDFSSAWATSCIRAKYPSYDPGQEVAWAVNTASHSEWNDSITRATIMICRQLAYRVCGREPLKNREFLYIPAQTMYNESVQMLNDSVDRVVVE